MSSRIKLSTKTTNQPPIVVELDGVVYKKATFSTKDVRELLKHEDAAASGDFGELCKQFQIMTGAPLDAIEGIDVRDLQEKIVKISNMIFQPEVEAAKEDTPAIVKNGIAPEKIKSP